MKHIADGDLHAYLDGALELYPPDDAERIRAHLEVCEPCRERLREEEGLHNAAKAVLDAGAPGSVVPLPFEELRRRAEASRPEGSDGSGAPSRLRKLAWAASVAVALGMGWMAGRTPFASPSAPGLAFRMEGEATATTSGSTRAPEETGAIESRLATARDDDAGGRAVEADVEATREAAALARVAAAPSPAPMPEAVEAAPMAMESPRRVREALGDRSTADQAGAPPAAVLAEPVPPAVLRDRAAASWILRASAEEVTAPVISGSRVVESSDSIRQVRGRPVTALMQRAPAGALVIPDLSARSEADRLDARPMDVQPSPAVAASTGDGAARAAPEAPLQIPGLAVVGMDFADVAPGVGAVRVVQMIPGDTVHVEVFFGGLGTTRDGASGEVPERILRSELPEGVHQVAKALESGWVVVRGRIPEAGLRSLLRLLR